MRSYGDSGESGLIDKCKCGVAPLISWLFPNVPRQSRAFSYITTNMISNFLGLGWAATPAGIRAMQELSELNGPNSVASCDMLYISGNQYIFYTAYSS